MFILPLVLGFLPDVNTSVENVPMIIVSSIYARSYVSIYLRSG